MVFFKVYKNFVLTLIGLTLTTAVLGASCSGKACAASANTASLDEASFNRIWNHITNGTATSRRPFPKPEDFPLLYRVIATALHTIIFAFGVAGNTVLMAVVWKSRTLQTPTYAYLVSLAFADMLVLLTAVPEAIAFHHMGKQWLLGSAGCAIFVFLNFLGINAGSLSILAFTIERFIAICKPLYARKMCTLERTHNIITFLWLFAIVYCCPWLGLTEVKPDKLFSDRVQCEFRVPPDVYVIVFAADMLLFYIVPLIVAVVVYTKIGRILYKSIQIQQDELEGSSLAESVNRNEDGEFPNSPTDTMASNHTQNATLRQQNLNVLNSRTQVLRILIVIVVLFAIAWLPFRGLLIYNSFVAVPWLNIWYLLFAKTLIYANAAMNPLLYNAMSQRFRMAVYRVLCGKTEKKKSRPPKRDLVVPQLFFPPELFASDIKIQSDKRRRESNADSGHVPNAQFPLWTEVDSTGSASSAPY